MAYLPSEAPFRYHAGLTASHPTENKDFETTNPEITRCLTDEAAFFESYVKLTNRAIDAYAKAGRRKFALRLHGTLAALDL